MKPILLFGCTMVILMASCNKGYEKKVYVYKSVLDTEPTSLYVNGKYVGLIPYVVTTNQSSSSISISLAKGKHDIIAKDEDGNQISKVQVNISHKGWKIGPFNTSQTSTSVSSIDLGKNYSFIQKGEAERTVLCIEKSSDGS
jgi:hypothetical protein